MKRLAWLILAVTPFLAPASAVEPIVSEAIIRAPVASVWNAWTTSSGLQSWLAPHADIDLRIDGLMRSNYDPKEVLGDPGTIENRILAYEPERMLAIKVSKAPARFPFSSKIGEMWTVIYFEATYDGHTALKVVGMGFGTDDESQKMKEFFKKGNAFTLIQLQKRFEK